MLVPGAEDPEKDVQLYINSPGGSITAGMAIYDTMQYIKNRCHEHCALAGASMAAILLAAGSPKKPLRAAELAHPDPPAADERTERPGDRHRHPCPRILRMRETHEQRSRQGTPGRSR